MSEAARFLPAIPLEQLKVWVLAPSLITNDPNLEYYYDFSQSIAEYTRSFASLQLPWVWQPVTVQDYAQVIDGIVAEKKAGIFFPVVLNLCDGDEVNGTPGISVVQLLEEKQLMYTGSDAYFYQITTSKIPMKEAFDASAIATPKWEAIRSVTQNLDGIFERLGTPLLIKPAVSGGSMGVGIRNVVHTPEALKVLVTQMFEGYRGWNLAADGLLAETFIAGREFTAMVVGSHQKPKQCVSYTPVERVFHDSLPETEKFLSFDRLWEIYEEETPIPGDANFYEYHCPGTELQESIQQLCLDAYVAVGGTGYARIDVRMDKEGHLYILEVNAQCGLSEDEDYTSTGAILRFSQTSFTEFIVSVINEAFKRKKRNPARVRSMVPAAPANTA